MSNHETPTTATRNAAKIAAIRTDHIVGRGTCSMIDECFSDAELLEALKEDGVKSALDARSWARRLHKNHEAYGDDIRATAF